jgi:CheY-like chemotaxis protein
VLVDALAGALLQIKQGFVPDMIISDYRLREGENGLETIHRLRQVMRRQVPACLISGDTDPELAHQAKLAGLTLLHKPVRLAKLRSLIQRLIL